ncbi:MAG: urea ABC transporter ATP-binding protein UrtD [Oscillospiraceae bacterium]|jgi:urea transport system ATP-binding protein|nr:urea ABC transporter ATP-binding protein UrtD [Oscillospiraceae bacterium]
MEDALLDIRNLSISFSGFHAVSDVSMRVKQGSVHVVIGPNGAGKSTLMDMITGKSKPTAGQILFHGKDIAGMDPGVIAAKYKIGRKFQGPNVFDNMTVYENVEIALAGYTTIAKAFRYRRNAAVKQEIQRILQLVCLETEQDRVASELSHGQRQWLEIGMVMIQSPELIALDEPAAGMTDDETFKTGELIKKLAGKHTLLVIEHDMDFVQQIADCVTVLNQGKVLAEGTFCEVKENPQVIKAYLQNDEGEGY